MEKQIEAQRKAREIYETEPDWVTFFRELLGVGGIVRQMYPSTQALAGFEKTTEYSEIQAMLAKLREKNKSKTIDTEPTRVITVRLPKSLHESLTLEAEEYGTSINQLCISKLLQFIDKGRVPADSTARKPKTAVHEAQPIPQPA
jgi:predicted HicB family RNase H-like nuclease